MVKVKKQPRMEIIRALLKELRWLQSKENAVRMDDKRIQGHGIVVDAVMICFQFAEKLGMDTTQIMNELLLAIGKRTHCVDEDFFFKLWKESEKMIRKEEE
jgi:hypothetical protein